MTVREKMHQLVDTLPEQEILRLIDEASHRNGETDASHVKTSETMKELLERMGPWEDDRTTEEIIRDIYEARTISTRDCTL